MDNEGFKERRKHKRFPFRQDILIDGARRSTIMDISEGGLYISVMQSYEINDLIDLSIPFNEEELILKAQVRHCQPGIGMGVQFVDLTRDQEAKIKDIIGNLKG